MIEALIHRMKIRQTELQVALAHGVPPTWEAYKRMVGEYQGIQYVLDTIDNMLDEESSKT
jgi:endo-1,4-beta-D-glucanase Y